MYHQEFINTYLRLSLHILPLHYITEHGQCSCNNPNCHSPGKHPVTPRGVYDATNDPYQIWSYWGNHPYNIGIVTGKVNGCIVVDVDPRNGGLETLKRLNLNTSTLAVSTGGNGYHYYYQYPEIDIKLPGKLGDGIELKKDKGYVVAPPSNHASGGGYQWLNNEPLLSAQYVIDVLPKPKKPDELDEQLDDIEQNYKQKLQFAQYKLDEYAAVLANTQADRMITMNNHAYYLGGLIARGLLKYKQVYQTLEASALQAGLEQYEIQSALRGSITSGMQNPVDLGHIDEQNRIDQWWQSCQEGMYESKIADVSMQLDGIENERLKTLFLDESRTVPTRPLDPGEDWTPNGLANRLRDIYTEHFGHCPVYTRQNLYVYHSEGAWEVIEPEYLTLPLWWSGTRHPNHDKPLLVTKLGTGARSKKNILGTLYDMLHVEPFFDSPAPGVYFSNGRLHEGKLYEHSPNNRSLFVIPHEYDPSADPAAWDRFMDTVLPDKEMQQAFHEFIGLALFGRTHSYEVAMLMHGTGNNGKSTTLDVVKALFDPRHVTAVEPQDMAKPDFAVKLLESKINIVADMSARDLKDGAPLKKVISGEQIQAKYLYKDRFDFAPRTAVILAANELPDLGDQTKGFARKLLVLPFDQEITRDKDIKDYWKILLKDGLPGLIKRAVDAYDTVSKRGFLKIPRAAADSLKEWKTQSDAVSQFLQNYLEEKVKNIEWVSVTDLYLEYKAWAELYGEPKDRIGMKSFSSRIRILGIAQSRRVGKRGFAIQDFRSIFPS
jgi:P4 family phage/plasmid primase-like protien